MSGRPGQASTDQRLRGLGRRQALGLLAVGLLTLALAGANWWRGEQAAGRAAERITALEEHPAVAAMVPAVSLRAPGSGSSEVAGPALADTLNQTLTRISGQLERMETGPSAAVVMDDLLERLRRAEDRLADAAGALGERRASGAALERQVADLAGAQRALDARVAGLDPVPVVSPSRRRSSPRSPPRLGVSMAPQVQGLTETAYGVQLVVYTNPDRLQPFAQRHGLAGRAVVVETRFRGRDGYAVLIGPFASEDAVRARRSPTCPLSSVSWTPGSGGSRPGPGCCPSSRRRAPSPAAGGIISVGAGLGFTGSPDHVASDAGSGPSACRRAVCWRSRRPR